MFTGIIQDVGYIIEIHQKDRQTHICFSTNLNMQTWAIGDSIAVNGCCLTVTDFPEKNMFRATLSEETLRCTGFAQAIVGELVNLEPALRIGDALGGHMVSGHIDTRTHVLAIQTIGEHLCINIALPTTLMSMVANKGSICLQGVSLTVNHADQEYFSVNLIPHTLKATTLGQIKEGDALNIEVDMMARYAQRLLEAQLMKEENT